MSYNKIGELLFNERHQESMTHLLLTTKLFFPPLRSGLLERPRLVELLKRGLAGPVTLISAPAGYGKTTLLSEWRQGAGRQYPAAWFSLDAGDNDPSRFLIYLTASLDMLQPGLVQETISLLQHPQSIPIEDILTSLLHDLDQFPEDFILVLDDLHVITEPQIYQILLLLIDYLPPMMHLAILTRADPPLPISRLRARNQLIEIRMEHLRCTQEETQKFFSQVMQLKLSEGSASSINLRAEGWITGLQLCGLSMRGRSPEELDAFIQTFTGSHHYILDYLIEEVLSLLDQSMKDFLFKTSILGRLCGSLCNAVAGCSNGQATLETLEHSNMFVFPMDDERHWYRYHNLFADALRNRLHFYSPESLRELHLVAAAWYDKNMLVEEAAHHALLAEDYPRVARLIHLHWFNLINQGQSNLVLEWLKAIPEAILNDHPNLFLIRSWVSWYLGNVSEAERFLLTSKRALSKLETSTGMLDSSIDLTCEALLSEVLALESSIATSKGQFEKAIILAKEALAACPDRKVGGGIAYISLFYAYREMGSIDEAIDACMKSIPLAHSSHFRIREAACLGALVEMLFIQGRLHEAEKTCLEITQPAEQLGKPLSFPFSLMYVALADVLVEWNDLENARPILELGINQTERAHLATYQTMYITLARFHGSHGNWHKALEVIDRALIAARKTRANKVIGKLEAYRAGVLTRLGRIPEAELWLKSIQTQAGEKFGYQVMEQNLYKARVWIATGNLKEAQELLENIEGAAQKRGNVSWQIESLLLQAVILREGKLIPEALSYLEKAISLAEEEGFVRIFLNEGAPILDLLRRSKQGGNLYAAKLLSFLDQPGSVQQPPSLFQDPGPTAIPYADFYTQPLSNREMDVLHLLADGCTNKEIASQLVISVGTVKRHVVHIFRKLDAINRTQAVAIARERKII